MKTKQLILLFLLTIFVALACNNDNKTTGTINKTCSPSDALVITTAKDTDFRMKQSDKVKFVEAKQALETENSIFVNSKKRFQKIVGIGGAITDASAEVFYKLSKAKQSELLNAYFSKFGNNYSLIRTTIHSCDFSSNSYTYIKEGDKELKSFSIDKDLKYRVPFIKDAIATHNNSMFIFASPWSPPAFMKTNNNMLNGGKLLPEYYDTWAKYFVKFIKEYKGQGIDIKAVTIQNEPMAIQTWESCIYTANEERDFLKNHLGPALHNNGLGNTKVIVWDHNRDLIVQRANTILDDKEASKYVWGIGFHWYETWRKAKPMFDNIKVVHENFPDKKLFFTEGCNEAFDKLELENWDNAERYGLSMIEDFNNGTVAWTDWNILLDMTGGPNHVGNLCFAPVHADTENNILHFTPSFYYLGHFSKYVKPKDQRISTSSSFSNLHSTSFIGENNKIATIVLNISDKELKYNLYCDNKWSASISIPAHSIQTIVYQYAE